MNRRRISRNFGRSGSMVLRLAITLAAILLSCSPVLAASERPRAGQGVLFLRPAFPEQSDEIQSIVLYETPGVERITVLDVARLPSLAPSVSAPSGGHAIAVTGTRGNWFRVAYDDAGREGWVEGRRFWSYFSWPDFLVGRSVVLLPGLRAALTQLRLAPSDDSLSLGQIPSEQRLRVLEISDEWVRISSEGSLSGWFRWRDRDGKLLLAVEMRSDPREYR